MYKLFRRIDILKVSFKLPDKCSIIQAKISAIIRTVKRLRYHIRYEYRDNKAAIISLKDEHITSNLVHKCRTTFNAVLMHSNMGLQWVRPHGTSTSSIIVDGLAQYDTNLSTELVN